MSKISIRTAALGLALAVGVAVPVFAQTAGGVLVVNVGRVFEESAAGKAAIAQLRPQVDQLTQRQRSYQEQFQREERAIQQSAAQNQPGKAPATPIATLQQRARDLQQREQTANTELQGRQQALQASDNSVRRQILEGMTPIVNALLKEHNASVAIPTSVALGNVAGVDVTTDVISRLDRALPRVSTTPPAAPAAR
jgi:outer membrane protein